MEDTDRIGACRLDCLRYTGLPGGVSKIGQLQGALSSEGWFPFKPVYSWPDLLRRLQTLHPRGYARSRILTRCYWQAGRVRLRCARSRNAAATRPGGVAAGRVM